MGLLAFLDRPCRKLRLAVTLPIFSISVVLALPVADDGPRWNADDCCTTCGAHISDPHAPDCPHADRIDDADQVPAATRRSSPSRPEAPGYGGYL